MTQRITTTSIIATIFSVIFGVCIYLVQFEFSNIAQASQRQQEHNMHTNVTLAELAGADKTTLEKVMAMEKQLVINGEKIEQILTLSSERKYLIETNNKLLDNNNKKLDDILALLRRSK